MKKGKRDEIISETKKPIYKKWWFWLIVVIVIIGYSGINSNSKTETKNETKTESSSESAKKSSADKTEKEAKETADKIAQEAALKAANEKAAKEAADKEAADKAAADKAAQDAADKDPNSYQALPYEEMARNGDNHKGEKLQINGKVIQVMDSDKGFATLRVATRDGYDDIYMIEIPASQWKSHRLLKDDIITFYGKVYGLYSYDSTMGGKITVPAMTANMY